MLSPQQASFVLATAVAAVGLLWRGAAFAPEDDERIGFQSGIELSVDDGRGERAISVGRVALIGRASNADIQLHDPQVSRLHARIEVREDGVYVEDLGSRNGTARNGVRIASPTRVERGDELLVGTARVVFRGLGKWR